MRSTGFLVLVLGATLGAMPAAAEPFDGTWSGTLSCAQLSITIGPLRVPLQLTVSHGRASYSRHVLNQQGTAVVGSEEGMGTVGDRKSVV